MQPVFTSFSQSFWGWWWHGGFFCTAMLANHTFLHFFYRQNTDTWKNSFHLWILKEFLPCTHSFASENCAVQSLKGPDVWLVPLKRWLLRHFARAWIKVCLVPACFGVEGFVVLSGARTSWARWWQQALGTLVGQGWRGQVTLCSRVVKQSYQNQLP